MNTGILANTSMETYTQGKVGKGQTCMDCHAYATPQGTTTNNSTNQIFTFVLDNADAPTPALRLRPERRRRVKLPQRVLDIIHGMRKAK